LWNDRVREELRHGKHAEILKQLGRRGIVEVMLPAVPPRADLDKIAAAFQLAAATGKEEELMRRVVADHGLGKFVKFLAAASRLAKKRGVKLSWSHFIEAHDVIVKLSVEPKKEAA
jgi:phosphoglycolate phosphatase-like HAD superfamily hydrolase